MVRRLPSPVPEELEVPLAVMADPRRADGDEGEKVGAAADGESQAEAMKTEPSNGTSVVAGLDGGDVVEVNGHSKTTTNGQADPVHGGETMDVDADGPQEGESTVPPDSTMEKSAELSEVQEPLQDPGQDSTLQEPATPTIPLAETERAVDAVAFTNGRDEKLDPAIAAVGHVPPSLNGTQPLQSPTKTDPTPVEPQTTSTQRIDTLKARQAEMYAHRLVPAMASRDLLPEIGKLARDMLRSADEKVGIAIGTYNTVCLLIFFSRPRADVFPVGGPTYPLVGCSVASSTSGVESWYTTGYVTLESGDGRHHKLRRGTVFDAPNGRQGGLFGGSQCGTRPAGGEELAQGDEGIPWGPNACRGCAGCRVDDDDAARG